MAKTKNLAWLNKEVNFLLELRNPVVSYLIYDNAHYDSNTLQMAIWQWMNYKRTTFSSSFLNCHKVFHSIDRTWIFLLINTSH